MLMPDADSAAPKPDGDTVELRSLSPQYVADRHASYVTILVTELQKTGPQAPLNVALTGHYGSGKSSILNETTNVLQATGVNVVNLSLPSLGIGDARIQSGDEQSLSITNLIQKEIVKQLLYRRKPADTPASRYNRLDTFHESPARRRAALGAFGVAGAAALAGAPAAAEGALPAQLWVWLNRQTWEYSSTALSWVVVAVIFYLTFQTAMWLQRLLQQRIRVTELAAGPTRVTLSEASIPPFDEYLDEIVYFFQTSATGVVVFEDLDRFRDPHIFETLHELNLLLNNAEQTGVMPIRFVYAIRDSIFEQLDSDERNSLDDEVPDRDNVQPSETRRLMSTNRTKFFDLVVPIVPFISHRTSKDLIVTELKSVPPAQRPSDAVADLVGAHLTDMRLIKNICNEYDVFRRRILIDEGLKELTADRLFASIVYKNLYLADYEKLRDGESRLDSLYSSYRDWVAHCVSQAQTAEATARLRLRRIDGIAARAKVLGERLQAVLKAHTENAITAGQVQITGAGATYAWADLRTAQFWREVLEKEADLTIYYRPGYAQGNISFASLVTLMGRQLSAEDWDREDRDKHHEALNAALTDRRSAAHASLADALHDSKRSFTYEGEQRSVAYVADAMFGGDSLIVELLMAGYIDENFTLYITQFPGQSITATAMNFIIKAVQRNVSDVDYHFGVGKEVDAADIEAVLTAEPVRVLDGQSVYNIEIFDYLLSANPKMLDGAIRRLASGSPENLEFIERYLTSGTHASDLVTRLSGIWPNVLNFLIGSDPDARDPRLLDAAIRGLKPSVRYKLSDAQRDLIATSLEKFDATRQAQDDETTTAIAKTFQHLGVKAEDLTAIADSLRAALIERSLYAITRSNLVCILGDAESLALDVIRRARPDDVYLYMLANTERYLAVLVEDEESLSIDDPGQFESVLEELALEEGAPVTAFARRAAAGSQLNDLDLISSSVWPAVAAAGRFRLTVTNVARYLHEHGFDQPLSELLAKVRSVEVDQSETSVAQLALQIANAESLSHDVRAAVLAGMPVPSGAITVDMLTAVGRSVLPLFVKKGIVADDINAFTCLADDEWPIKEELIGASDAFLSYFTSLSLTRAELYWLATQPVAPEVKQALLDNLGTFESSLGPKAAAALSSWALKNGVSPTIGTIAILATKGGGPAAVFVIRLLQPHLASLEIEDLKPILNHLGRPYAQLTTPGRDRPKIPATEGLDDVLRKLSTAGIVSKYQLSTRGSTYEVSKRYK